MKLLLAQDEPGENDTIVEVEGYRFVVEKDLFKMASPITVDGALFGFRILSEILSSGGRCAR